MNMMHRLDVRTAEAQLEKLAKLLLLENRLRDARNEVELGFIVVNDTLELVQASTAMLWRAGSGNFNRGEVFAVSATPLVDPRSPFAVWASRVSKVLNKTHAGKAAAIADADLPKKIAADRHRHVAPEAAWLPLAFRGRSLGALVLWRDKPWTEAELRILQQWASTVAHAWDALRWSGGSMGILPQLRSRTTAAVCAALVLALLVPVRLSVLAPAELSSSESIVVRAPLNGVVAALHVSSNARVSAGEPLLDLDDRELRTRLEVAQQELEIARAEYRQASQAAAYSEEAKERLQVLRITLEKYVADVNYLTELLARTRVVADTSAIAIVDNSDEMVGRPVQLGERLLTLVDEAHLELELWVPVGDDIRLDPGAEVRFFPNVAPDEAYRGKLLSMDYQAQVSPLGTLAYRARASLDVPDGAPARIGMRGTGKLYGERVSLFYYLFRRPISFVRRTLGL